MPTAVHASMPYNETETRQACAKRPLPRYRNALRNHSVDSRPRSTPHMSPRLGEPTEPAELNHFDEDLNHTRYSELAGATAFVVPQSYTSTPLVDALHQYKKACLALVPGSKQLALLYQFKKVMQATLLRNHQIIPQAPSIIRHTMLLAHFLLFLVAAVALLAAPTGGDAGRVGITFVNLHPREVFVGGDWAAKDNADALRGLGLESLDRTIDSGASTFFPGLAGASPKFYISMSPADSAVGEPRTHNTAIELTWKGFNGLTYYDVDVERGFSVPVWCHGGHETWQQGQGCEGDILSDCPRKLQHLDQRTGDRDQCWSEASSEDVERRRRWCSTSYVVWNGDKTNTMTSGHGTSLPALSTLVQKNFN